MTHRTLLSFLQLWALSLYFDLQANGHSPVILFHAQLEQPGPPAWSLLQENWLNRSLNISMRRLCGPKSATIWPRARPGHMLCTYRVTPCVNCLCCVWVCIVVIAYRQKCELKHLKCWRCLFFNKMKIATLKKYDPAPACVVQLGEHCPMHQEVASSMPVLPVGGIQRATHQCFSPSPLFSL